MGILSRRLGVRALSLEDPAQPLLPPSALYETLGMGRSDAGVLMNEQQAMRITTAQACVNIISEDLATCAHEIIQTLPNGSVRRAENHRLWSLLHDEPNPNMSAAVFWAAMIASMLGWGNGYAWIKRDGAMRATALVPLHSGRTSPVKIQGKLQYGTTQTDTGKVAYLDPADVLHIKMLSFDGIVGVGPIQSCKNAFGLAYAAEKYGAQFFGNGARASGVLSYPGVLEEEAQKNLWKSLRERLNGDNALMPLILEEGMTWTQSSISPNEAQFLQTRQFQRVEIASLYRVAMHLLQDLQRATNNNIEHQSLDHVRFCLRPKAVKIEQEVNRKLLSGPFTMEHNLVDLQRGDQASQATALQIFRNIGVYSTDDCLRALRQNPIGHDAGGDVRTVQGAMIPLTSLMLEEAAPENAQVNSDEGDAQPFNRILPAYRVMARDAVGRVLNRKEPSKEFVQSVFRPLMQSLAQTLATLRFGSPALTKHDYFVIEGATAALATAAASWDKKDAGAIAARLTEQMYQVLAKEILE